MAPQAGEAEGQGQLYGREPLFGFNISCSSAVSGTLMEAGCGGHKDSA